MLDPLTALSLAACIAQFIDFGTKLVVKSNEIRKTGSSVDVRYLENIATDLKGLVGGLQSYKVRLEGEPVSENGLDDILLGCDATAQGLLERLKRLTQDPTIKHQRCASVRKALKLLWTKDEIEEVAENLNGYRQQLAIRLLVLLNAKNDAQADRLESKIIEVTALSHKRLKSAIQEGFSSLKQSSANQPSAFGSMNEHQETIVAGTLMLEDGTTRNLTHLIEHGTGFYWINGKAGSGKSTLMKYIQCQNATVEALKTWANGKELVVASFFFWRAGSSEQRTQNGMLRTLFFHILIQHMYLIPIIFPDLFRAISVGSQIDHDSIAPISDAELKLAFHSLLENTAHLKICLIIDALDESEGDHSALRTFLDRLRPYEHIKAIVASRPLNIFKTFFAESSSVRLQDLTSSDINNFIGSELERNKRFRDLKQDEDEAAESLCLAISEKADGVFLWVTLVIGSLPRGFENGDRISDLLRRIEELPSDLEALCSYMLASMEPRYKRQGARLLVLIMRCIQVQDGPPSILQILYAEDERNDLSMVLKAPIKGLALENRWYTRKVEELDARLTSRCCGLLEIYLDLKTSSIKNPRFSHVGFLHTTIMDFLRLDSVKKQLSSYMENDRLNPDDTLLYSCLYHAKSTELKTSTVLLRLDNGSKAFISTLFKYAVILEDTRDKSYIHVLDDFYQVMTSRGDQDHSLCYS
ncbi:hypothetical protein PVAG01_08224 [Phlyctema vagabunda]|uniref:NACHT domain-containing protein n=1 Tax=Phlyctema vagabunda TaxID=108571 RepID=A0ABR4P8T1_9HELO